MDFAKLNNAYILQAFNDMHYALLYTIIYHQIHLNVSMH